MTGSDRVRMRNRFPRFFLTIVVVQNVPLRMTRSNMATGCDVIKRHVTPKGFPWKAKREEQRIVSAVQEQQCWRTKYCVSSVP